MLQRIQSIFLIVALFANLSILLVPVWSFSPGNGSTEFMTALNIDAPALAEGENSMTAFDHQNTMKMAMHVSALGLSIVSGVLLLITIFLYNNRARQKSLAYVNVILSMLILVCLAVLTRQGPSLVTGGEGEAGIGFFMPVVAIIMIWLAIQRIQKDEDLVNSLDRIR